MPDPSPRCRGLLRCRGDAAAGVTGESPSPIRATQSEQSAMAQHILRQWCCSDFVGTRHLAAPEVQFLREGGKEGAGPSLRKKSLDTASAPQVYVTRYRISIL